MKSMTQLVFLIVFILLVSASIVFHKTHSASAQGPTHDRLHEFCVVVGDQPGDLSVAQARRFCDGLADFALCTAAFIRPPNVNDDEVDCPTECTVDFGGECWLCFGVECG
jgi:hypothetical protein